MNIVSKQSQLINYDWLYQSYKFKRMSESYMEADESDKDIIGMPKIRTEEVEQWARC